jgi:hypothetical protein
MTVASNASPRGGPLSAQQSAEIGTCVEAMSRMRGISVRLIVTSVSTIVAPGASLSRA